MGYYLNNDQQGNPLPAKGKVEALVKGGAKKIDTPVTLCENLVCVVNNSFFDAAAYVYSDEEFEEFTKRVSSPKTWLIVENAKEIAK